MRTKRPVDNFSLDDKCQYCLHCMEVGKEKRRFKLMQHYCNYQARMVKPDNSCGKWLDTLPF